MLLWVVRFPKNHKPREIAYRSSEQAIRMLKIFNIPYNKGNLKILYFEEDENVESFSKIEHVEKKK